MGLREMESRLPPGFRFHPSDHELVCHYLRSKVLANHLQAGPVLMAEVDLHAREPWDLPDVAKLTADEWYFFSFRDRKYATGSRTNRATKLGYWKATGKDKAIHDPMVRGAVAGMRKTLVFYFGRAPNGRKSGWVMHEFRLEDTPAKEDWVLCRVFHKGKGDGAGSLSSPPAATPVDKPDHHRPMIISPIMNGQGDLLITRGYMISGDLPMLQAADSFMDFEMENLPAICGGVWQGGSSDYVTDGVYFQRGHTYQACGNNA